MAGGAGNGGCLKALDNSTGVLAVLSGSLFTPDGTGPSKLGWVMRVAAPTEISAGPPATQDRARGWKGPREHPEADHWPEETSRTWWAAVVILPATSLEGKRAGKTERRVATADEFMVVGCSGHSGDVALSLAVLSR
mgnify:CR=1 FL=1